MSAHDASNREEESRQFEADGARQGMRGRAQDAPDKARNGQQQAGSSLRLFAGQSRSTAGLMYRIDGVVGCVDMGFRLPTFRIGDNDAGDVV